MEFEKALFYDYVQTNEGAFFKVYIPGFKLEEKLLARQMPGVIRIDDGRSISGEQRSLLYALFGEIAKSTSRKKSQEEIKELMKLEFSSKYGIEPFSLSNVDMTTAHEFIDYVLEFVFKWEIPLKEKVFVMAKEVNSYLYFCLMYRKCAICGKGGAHIHHVDTVGSGRNRNDVDHTKLRLIALCANHHTETHKIGWHTFSNKYHVAGIRLNKESLVKLKMMNKGEVNDGAPMGNTI